MEQMRPEGGEREFTLPPILKPLEKRRNDLLLLFGMDNKGNDRGMPGAGHYGGGPTCLTGEPLVAGRRVKGSGDPGAPGYDVGGASLDQVIAQSPAGATRFRSLQLGHSGGLLVNYLCASGKGSFIPNEPDLIKIYERLFTGLPTGGPGAAGPSPELTRLRAQRATVLDAVKGDLDGLETRLGAADRAVLDAHATGIRELERSLELALAAPAAGCARPAGPGALSLGESALERAVPIALELAAHAFQCDLTRVNTNMWVKSSSRQTYPWVGVTARHHDLSHKIDAATLAAQAKAETWWCQVAADFIDLLAAMPEAGGGTVFDSTLVVWAHELSNGAGHTAKAQPWVLAGSAGGAFQTGRYLELPGRTSNDLLTAIGQAFGLPITSFGKQEFNQGALTLG